MSHLGLITTIPILSVAERLAGDGYSRADLLPVTDAVKVLKLLKTYLDHRMLFYAIRDQVQLEKNTCDTAQFQNELWSTIRSVITAVPPRLCRVL